MSNFYEAFEREKKSDIRHYGVPGMKWGVIRKADMKGGKSGGIVRGMERSSGARGMESWDLKDKVERMKLESDYRKLTEEEETYAVTQAEKIRQAKIETVMSAVKTVGTVVSTTAGVIGLVKTISGSDVGKKLGKKIGEAADRIKGRSTSGRAQQSPQYRYDPKTHTFYMD